MTPPLPRLWSAALGLAMATVVAPSVHGPAIAAVIGAGLAVSVATLFLPAATLGVLLVVVAIVSSDIGPGAAAASGLCAAGYLVMRHTAAVTGPTVVAAIGFTLIGLVSTVFPLQLPWLPVLAPPLAFGCYAVVVQPFLAARTRR